MSDREPVDERIRELEHKIDSLQDEIHLLRHQLNQNFNDVNKNVIKRSEHLSWDMIKIFGGSVFLIIFTVMLILPFIILNSPKSQQTIIQVPAPVIEQKASPIEQKAPEIKMPIVEERTVKEQPIEENAVEKNAVEEKPSVQSRAQESFLQGLFSDLSLTIQHAMMVGVIVCLFKLIVQ